MNPGHLVNLVNLRRGIEHLFKYRKDRNRSGRGVWEFHDPLYRELKLRANNGISESFWRFLVDELTHWRAIRPRTKQWIFDQGIRKLPQLKRHYQRILDLHDGPEQSIEVMNWSELNELFSIAAEIKDVASPVFASKLCHFLLPPAFPVLDNTLVRSNWKTYEQYWSFCKNEWLGCTQKDILIAELQREMPTSPCSFYPWATKITELCCFDPE